MCCVFILLNENTICSTQNTEFVWLREFMTSKKCIVSQLFYLWPGVCYVTIKNEIFLNREIFVFTR